MMAKVKKFIDIGANLTDSMYAGIYNGNKKHEGDLKAVLDRSWAAGLCKIIITGGSLEESQKALELAKSNEKLFLTVGCHPTRCLEFETEAQNYYEKLKSLILENKSKAVAVGECGLDYDRTQFCPIAVQKKYFECQLKLAEEVNLPLFLHCRNAANDLYEILSNYKGLKGVVHSFDGTISEAEKFIDLGYYIGLNGCSLKTKENLETVKLLPDDKIMIETDAPWCEIRPTHAGHSFIQKENLDCTSVKKEKWKADCTVKGRNEPQNIRQVVDVIAGIKQRDAFELSELFYNNTLKVFFPSENSDK